MEFHRQATGLTDALRHGLGDSTLVDVPGVHGVEGIEHGNPGLF